MPSLTRDEAVDRAALVDVASYRIELDLTDAATSDRFTTDTTIRFSCAEPGAATFAQLRDATDVEVRLNGAELDAAAYAEGRIALRDLAADNEVTVRARLPYTHDGEGMHKFIDPLDGKTYVYATSSPANADLVFACFDQPDLKARVTLSVNAPAHWTVWANGAIASRDNGRTVFETTQPMSTYLVTVVAGDWHTVDAEHDGIPLGIAGRKSMADIVEANAEEIFAVTRASFDHYHAMFGIRYPFGNYFQAFVPEFNWGAMENPGCVTFNESMLFRGAATVSDREHRAVVIAHEMAHMWFGDLVTLRWWDDIWLNEAFAEYMGWRTAAEATEFSDAWTSFAVGRKAWGYAADQRPSTHPVAPERVRDADEALKNFDGVSYAKGASVLRQLAAWLGDEAFLRGLRSYFDTHAFGNATLDDLLDALAAASGRDLRAWAEVWLRQPQVNTLTPELAYTEDGRVESLAIVQSAPPEHPVLRPHRVRVAVYDGATAGLTTDVDIDPHKHGERTVVDAAAGARAGLVLINDADLTFAKARLDDLGRELLPQALSDLDDSLTRAVLWSSAANATRDAQWPAHDYLALAVATLPRQDDTVFPAVLGFAADTVVDQFLAPGKQPAARAMLAAACDIALRDA
ncbi:MAG TPA: aminopeptidase N, partial [Stackebrandtia sp.]|uniref:aminopeptidase N n=1 Tax=Stackebrandtia sp. TaxID=2023065 RepID=UPI002D74C678